jgi:hypothetical protein
MKKLLSTEVFCGDVLAHFINDKDVKETAILSDVRGGISMPAASAPGYCIFLGRERDANEYGEHPLRFLAEEENDLHQSLFEKMTSLAVKLRCGIVYARQNRTQRGIEGAYSDLWRFIRSKGLNLRLVPAPSAEDVSYGKVLVAEGLKTKALVFPESVPCTVKAQLQSMTPDSEGEELFAFHALRFLLAGYRKYAQRERPLGAVDQTSSNRKNPGGWC